MKPDRNPIIERMCERYWNAYRDGVAKAGLRDYPTWKESADPVKQETRRLIRHAVEELKPHIPDFDTLFADKPKKRSLKPIWNDQAQALSAQIAKLQ